MLIWVHLWTGRHVEGNLVENLNDWPDREQPLDPNLDRVGISGANLGVHGPNRGPVSPDTKGLGLPPFTFNSYLALRRTELYRDAGSDEVSGALRPPEPREQSLAGPMVLSDSVPDSRALAFAPIVDDPAMPTFRPILASFVSEVPNDRNGESYCQNVHSDRAPETHGALADDVEERALDLDFACVTLQMTESRRTCGIDRARADRPRTIGVDLREVRLDNADASAGMIEFPSGNLDQLQRAIWAPEATGTRPGSE